MLSPTLGYQVDGDIITALVFKSPLFYLLIVPKHKSGDAGNFDMSKRSHKVLPGSEKLCIYRGGKQHYTRFGNIYIYRHPRGDLERIPPCERGGGGGTTELCPEMFIRYLLV